MVRMSFGASGASCGTLACRLVLLVARCIAGLAGGPGSDVAPRSVMAEADVAPEKVPTLCVMPEPDDCGRAPPLSMGGVTGMGGGCESDACDVADETVYVEERLLGMLDVPEVAVSADAELPDKLDGTIGPLDARRGVVEPAMGDGSAAGRCGKKTEDELAEAGVEKALPGDCSGVPSASGVPALGEGMPQRARARAK